MVEDEVDAEIRSFREMFPGGWRAELLNNFYFNFPTKEGNGWYHDSFEGELAKLCTDGGSSKDVTMVRRLETLARKLDAVDEAIDACGIRREDISVLTSVLESAKSVNAKELFRMAYDAFADLVLPVYVHLRRNGFPRDSLVG